MLGKAKLSEKERVSIVAELRCQYSLDRLLKVAQMCRSTFYYHLKSLQKPDKYDEIKSLISNIFQEHKSRYGYRRITMELRNRGITINHKTVQRLMHSLTLKCVIRMKKYRSYKGQVGRIAPNILNRKFEATRPNQKWVTDVTQFAVAGQKMYLSPILDLYNGEIISYSFKDSPSFKQTKDMLNAALQRTKINKGLLLHSDQGWQYQMSEYQRILQENGIVQSMSRRGNCLDNAAMESFFGVLKSEMFYKQTFSTVEEFEMAIHDYIHYYNHNRLKGKLKGLSPVKYRELQSSRIA
jgi:putative transposase